MTFRRGGAPMTQTRSAILKGWVVTGALLLATGSAWGQQVFIYPQKGQSPQQQAQDTGECQAWATQQTGGAMAAPPPMASAPPPTASPLKGAARGAAVGSVGGAIGGNAGKGAAIGAATGAIRGGVRRYDQMQQARAQQAQRQEIQAAQAENDRRARS